MYKTPELLKVEHIEFLCDHMERHVAENGNDGGPVFMPFTPETYKRDAETIAGKWKLEISQPGWRRNWGIWSDGKVVANTQLIGGKIDCEMHRVELATGIEAAYRGKGLGSKLMETAIDWAIEKGFEWIDLGVYANNEPAIGLYEKFGFEQASYSKDRYRIFGESTDFIRMTKKLR